MTPKQRFVFWLTSVAAAGSLGAMLIPKTPGPIIVNPKELVATVNKQPITRAEITQFYTVCRSAIAGELVLDRLLKRTAEKNKIKLDLKETPAPPVEGAAPFLLGDLYLRRLILSEWPDERLRRFHSLFQEELIEYDVSCAEIVRIKDLSAVQEDLEREVDYTSLVSRYSIDETGKKHEWRRWYTKSELVEEFGLKTSQLLIGVMPGLCSRTIRSNSKVYIFSRGKTRRLYEELKPVLEDRIVEARRPAFLYELLAKAKVTVTGALGSDPGALEYRL